MAKVGEFCSLDDEIVVLLIGLWLILLPIGWTVDTTKIDLVGKLNIKMKLKNGMKWKKSIFFVPSLVGELFCCCKRKLTADSKSPVDSRALFALS